MGNSYFLICNVILIYCMVVCFLVLLLIHCIWFTLFNVYWIYLMLNYHKRHNWNFILIVLRWINKGILNTKKFQFTQDLVLADGWHSSSKVILDPVVFLEGPCEFNLDIFTRNLSKTSHLFSYYKIFQE